MNTYRFLAYPKSPLWANPSLQDLDAAGITRSIAGAIVHRLEPDSMGQFIVELALERPFHGAALDDITSGLEAMGWTVSQAIVTEWVTEAVTGATFGTGVGAVAGLSTEDPVGFFVLTVLGLAVGAGVGSLFKKIRAQHHGTRRPHYVGGGWELALLPPQPDQVGAQVFSQ
jgi:hypothetical protein